MNRIAMETKTKKYNYTSNDVLSGILPSGRVSQEVRYQERVAVYDVLRYGKISTDY